MESLYDKSAKVVQKAEALDPDDNSVDYEVILLLDEFTHGKKRHHTTLIIRTDDKVFYDKFTLGKDVDMKMLEKEGKLKPFPKSKAN